MFQRTSHLFYGSSLFTLPWIGLGLIKWSTGVDVGAGLQISWLLMFLAMILLVMDKTKQQGIIPSLSEFWAGIPSPWRIGAGLTILAVLVSGCGLLVARVQESSWIVWSRYIRQIIQLSIMGFFVLWPALWTRGSIRWRWTVQILVISALVQAAYGLVQGISFYQPNGLFFQLESVFTSNPAILSGSEQLHLGNLFRDVPRLRGTACEPLYLGSYILMVMPWALLGGLGSRIRWTAGVILGMLILATWSRGAWLGLLIQIVGWLILVFLARNHRSPARPSISLPGLTRIGWIVASILLLLLALDMLLGREALFMPLERVIQSFSRQDWSNLTRLYSMQAAWRAFNLSPLVGVGWGQFAWHFPVLADPVGLQSQFEWPMVNNFPLKVLCETGIIGFMVFIGSALGLGRAVLHRLRDRDRENGMVIPASLAVIGIWTQLLTFSQYNLPHIWIALGLLLAALRDESLPQQGSSPGQGGAG